MIINRNMISWWTGMRTTNGQRQMSTCIFCHGENYDSLILKSTLWLIPQLCNRKSCAGIFSHYIITSFGGKETPPSIFHPPAMSLISAFRPRSTRDSFRLRQRKPKNRHDTSEVEEPEDDDHSIITPSKHTPRPFRVLRGSVAAGGPLRPFRLVKQDVVNLRRRYISDWSVFNQLIFASAVYVFFTNLLPGITFASDLYVLTGKCWGTIEVVFSTGLCGVIFSL